MGDVADVPADLLRNLQRGQQQRERARKVKVAMVSGLVIMVIVAVGLATFASRQRDSAVASKRDADQKADEAKKSEAKAVKKEGEARASEEKAIKQEGEAKKSAKLAIASETKAKASETKAKASAAEAVASAYRATVGQIAALIEGDEFQTARSGLKRLKESATSRGWEWERLKYLTLLSKEPAVFDQPPVALAWSSTGRLAVADARGQITLCEVEDPNQNQRSFQLQQQTTGTDLQVSDLAFSPDGQRLAIVGTSSRGSSAAGVLEIWEVDNARFLSRLPQPSPSPITACCYLQVADVRYLLIGTASGQVQCLETNQFEQLEAIDSGGAVQQLVVVDRTSPPGSAGGEAPLVIACGADGVALWDFIPQGSPNRFSRVGKFREHTGQVDAVAAIEIDFSGTPSETDQDVLIVTAGDRRVFLWTLSDWREMLAREQTTSGLALRPPASSAGSAVPQGAVRERRQPQLLRLSLDSEIRSLGLQWSSPGRHADGESKSVQLLIAGSQNTLQQRTLQIRERSAAEVESANDLGSWEITGSGSWTISESSHQLLRGHEKPLTQVLFDPRPEVWREVATISADRTLRRWDLASYEEQRVAQLLKSEQAIFSSTAIVGDRVFAAAQTGHLWEWPFRQPSDQPQRHFEGHQFLARNVALIHRGDDPLLLTTSRDQSANLWDLATRSQVGYWERFCGPQGLLAVAPDGRQVISDAPGKGTVREGDEQAATFELHRWRLPGSDEDPVAAAPPRPEVLTTPHRSRITRLAFAPGGGKFVSGDAAGMVYIWSADRGIEAQPLQSFPATGQPAEPIEDIRFLTDDLLIIAFANGTIHEYRVDSGNWVRTLHSSASEDGIWQVHLVRLAVRSESLQLAALISEVRPLEADREDQADQDAKLVYRYSIRSWSGEREASTPVSATDEEFIVPPTGLAYSPAGDLIATVQGPVVNEQEQAGASGQTLVVWQTDKEVDRGRREFKLQRRQAGIPAIESLVFWDRERLMTVGRRSAIVWRIPAAGEGRQPKVVLPEQESARPTAREVLALEPQGAAHAISASPDGQLLLTANDEGTATLWETGQSRVVGHLRPKPEAAGAWLPSIRAATFATPHVEGQPQRAATGDARGGLWIWRIGADQRIDQWRVRWPTGERVEGITALAWRGQRLAVGTLGGAVYLFDDPQLGPVDPGDDPVIDLVSSAALIPEQLDRAKSIAELVFDPSGQFLAVAKETSPEALGGLSRLRVYKLQKTPRSKTQMVLFRRLMGHSQAITCATFLGRGASSRLATGSRDGTVKIWQWNFTAASVDAVDEGSGAGAADQEPARELLSLKAHQGAVSSLNFSEQENALISSGSDGRIIVWEATSDDRDP